MEVRAPCDRVVDELVCYPIDDVFGAIVDRVGFYVGVGARSDSRRDWLRVYATAVTRAQNAKTATRAPDDFARQKEWRWRQRTARRLIGNALLGSSAEAALVWLGECVSRYMQRVPLIRVREKLAREPHTGVGLASEDERLWHLERWLSYHKERLPTLDAPRSVDDEKHEEMLRAILGQSVSVVVGALRQVIIHQTGPEPAEQPSRAFDTFADELEKLLASRTRERIRYWPGYTPPCGDEQMQKVAQQLIHGVATYQGNDAIQSLAKVAADYIQLVPPQIARFYVEREAEGLSRILLANATPIEVLRFAFGRLGRVP